MRYYNTRFALQVSIIAGSEEEAKRKVEKLREFIKIKIKARKEWLVSRESQFVKHLLIKIKARVGAEVGVLAGSHAESLLGEKIGLKKLYLVDPYTDYLETRNGEKKPHLVDGKLPERLKKRLAKFEGRCVFIQKPSVEAAKKIKNESLDFVYIDANHSKLKEDIKAWYPKVRVGGIIGGHDYLGFEEVAMAVRERFGKDFDELGDDWWHFKKEKK